MYNRFGRRDNPMGILGRVGSFLGQKDAKERQQQQPLKPYIHHHMPVTVAPAVGTTPGQFFQYPTIFTAQTTQTSHATCDNSTISSCRYNMQF